jgi:hypothetical protein
MIHPLRSQAYDGGSIPLTRSKEIKFSRGRK